MKRQVERVEGKVDPTAAQADATVPWPIQEVISQQLADVGQDLGVAGWVKAVAAIVHLQTGKFETGSDPADLMRSLQHGDLRQLAPGQLERRTKPSRSCS
jgi:hypothetical protein